MEANLQVAAIKRQSTADHVAAQATQALADARSAVVELPRLDATMVSLQQELQAIKVAAQQANESAMQLETALSAAQDCIGAVECKAAQAEKQHTALQQRMDDWDAFDPNLHAALQASVASPLPNAGQQMQPPVTVTPASSAATGGQSAHQAQDSAVFGHLVQQVGTSQSHGATIFPFVQQAQPSVHLAQTGPPLANLNGGAVDSTGGSDISLVFPGAGGSSNGVNGGNGPSFPPRSFGSPS